MSLPLHERLQQMRDLPLTATLPTVEDATLYVRLFLEHTAEMNGHDLLPWSYNQHDVVSSRCQLCGAGAQIFYRANREPRHTHGLQERCPAR